MIAPIALTCGDPAGIGPELAVQARQALLPELAFYWIGDPAHLPADTQVVVIEDPHEASSAIADGLPVYPIDFGPEPVRLGRPNFTHAQPIINTIETAVDHVKSGAARAMCTAPISKQVLIEGAGFAYPGHTEFLAALGGVRDVVMMLACADLRAVPVTIHMPLAKVPGALTPDLLERTIRITARALQSDFQIAQPRIAVAGLNPHAGEGGALGSEDAAIIAPVIEKLAAEGMTISGPLPADTMFHPPARAKYDVAICMYHDQALIPVKTLGFDEGVNVTLGLPFVRTSPDHGTAFDIAGKGIAKPDSLIAALHMADRMAGSRARQR